MKLHPAAREWAKQWEFLILAHSELLFAEGQRDFQKPDQSYDPHNLQVSEVRSKIAPQEPGHCFCEIILSKTY